MPSATRWQVSEARRRVIEVAKLAPGRQVLERRCSAAGRLPSLITGARVRGGRIPGWAAHFGRLFAGMGGAELGRPRKIEEVISRSCRGCSEFCRAPGREALLHERRAVAASLQRAGIVLGGELLATRMQRLELRVHLHIGRGRRFAEIEVDSRGDDGRGGAIVLKKRLVGGVRVSVDGSLAEWLRPVERADGGDVAGGIDVDFKVDRSGDARGFCLGGVNDGGEGEWLVLNRGCGGKLAGLEQRNSKECDEDHGWTGYLIGISGA